MKQIASLLCALATTVACADTLAIVTDATLPVALTDVSYWQPIAATGGEEPYTWEIVDADDFPGWMYSDNLDEYGELYGWPGEDDIGTCIFALRVTDAEGTSVERTFTLEVQENPNHAPVIESWAPSAARFRLDPGATTNLSVVAYDPDGDELTYSWSIHDENWSWWESGDSTNAVYAFSRSVGQEGTNIVEVCVSDGLRDAYHSWTIFVQEKTPLAIATDATLPVALTEVSYSLVLEASGGEEPYTWEIVDADDFPGWMYSDNLDEYGELYGWPGEDDIGTCIFALRVTDAEGTSVERTFTLEVQEDPNHAPVIESWAPSAARFRLDPGATTNLSVVAYDPDGDELTYSWGIYNEYWNWLEDGDSTNAVYAFSRSVGQEGTNIVEVRVSDGSRDAYQSWTILVQEKTPLAIATDATLPVALTEVSYSLVLEASGGEEPYTWEIVDADDFPGWMYSSHLDEYGGLYGWPGEDDIGTYAFALRVTDAEGTSLERTFALEVRENPNHAPVIDSVTPGWDDYLDVATTPIGETVVFSVEAHDPEGDPLTYRWQLDGEPLEETGPSWTWTPTAADRGSHELGVYCSDGELNSGVKSLYFDVVSSNVLRAVVDLPIAVAGTPYSAAFAVSGGTEPYIWVKSGYAMARAANSFAETGAAQDWSEDDVCWSVALPFSFPFYGESYDTIWVSDNGTICLDGGFARWQFDRNEFKSHALIAPLWVDLDGSLQTIYVDSSVSGRVAIRWAARYYTENPNESDPVVSFSATLCSDGTIRFAYGDEARAGAVGISAGDGARFLLPGDLQGAALGDGGDVVFRPATFAPGLALSEDGTVAGTPTAAGTYRTLVTVVDAEGTSWSGTADFYVVEANAAVTRTTPAPVPHSWLAGHGFGDGTASGYEAAALASAANGRPVWACYVADLDPADADADLVADIAMVDGEPEITIRKGESADRVYETQGAPAPGGPWGERTGKSRFFRVKASLPASPE